MKKKIRISSVIITLIFIAGCAVAIYAIRNVPQSNPVPDDGANDVTASLATEAEGTTEAQGSAQIQKLAADINKADSSLTVEMLTYCGNTCGADKLESVLSAINDKSYTEELWYKLCGSSLHVLRDMANGNTEKDKNITVMETPADGDGTVEIGFVGDINLSDTWNLMQHYNTTAGLSECISPDLLKIMNGMDIMFANNEFTFSDGGKAQSGKSYTFRSDPKNVSLLKDMGIDIVSVANNHIYDYGEEAFLDTFTTLDNAGIGHVGAGDTLESASQAHYFIVNGRKIAFVSAGETYPQYRTPAAGEKTAGILPVETKDEMVAAIKAAAEQSDYVFAYAHWGYENINWYSDLQTELGKAFIDAGADAVVGSHPHVLQGMEFYNDKLIAYSLGNFWFNMKTMSTALLKFSIDKDGTITPVFYPCEQSGGNTKLKTDKADMEKLFYTVEGFCRNWVIDIKSDGTVTKAK